MPAVRVPDMSKLISEGILSLFRDSFSALSLASRFIILLWNDDMVAIISTKISEHVILNKSFYF